MKNLTRFLSALLFIAALCLQFSCDQSAKKTSENAQVKNTLKSVSLFQDSIGIDPIQLLASFKEVNKAIDSIGYPNAGYMLWEVISDDPLEFRFMVEGYWPNKETYDLIHENELYKEAITKENATWANLKSTWYNRFNKIEE